MEIMKQKKDSSDKAGDFRGMKNTGFPPAGKTVPYPSAYASIC
jgi:hypothetical protein